MQAKAFALFVLVMLAGCLTAGCTSIRFTGDTVVDEAGNVIRTAKLSTSNSNGQRPDTSRYGLPSGGSWTESVGFEERPGPFGEVRRVRVVNLEYAVTRPYARGESVAGDYRFAAKSADGAAYNEIAIDTSRYWFVETYTYEETFRDIVTFDGFSGALREAYAVIVDAIAERIAMLPGSRVSQQEAAARLATRFDSDLEAILSFFKTECFPKSILADACEAALERELDESPELGLWGDVLEDDGESLVAEIAGLFPPSPGTDPDEWLALNEDVVDSALASAEDRKPFVDEEAFMERVTGAHASDTFTSHPFELHLTLPGRIVETNADVNESGTLSWKFDDDDFMFHPHTAFARSRVVHPDRVAIAVALMMLVVTAGAVGYARRRGRSAAD